MGMFHRIEGCEKGVILYPGKHGTLSFQKKCHFGILTIRLHCDANSVAYLVKQQWQLEHGCQYCCPELPAGGQVSHYSYHFQLDMIYGL